MSCNKVNKVLTRLAPFTNEEIHLLVSLTKKFPIILRKIYGFKLYLEKNDAWERLTKMFNNQGLGTKRTHKRLRIKYRQIKKSIRTKLANNCEIPLNDYEQNLLCILAESGNLEGNKLPMVPSLIQRIKRRRAILSRKKLHRRFGSRKNLKQNDDLHSNSKISKGPKTLQDVINEKYKQYKFEDMKINEISYEHSETMKNLKKEMEIKKMQILRSNEVQNEMQLALRDQHALKMIDLRTQLEIKKAELEKIQILNSF